MKALFLVPRPDKASTRYRVLQYLPALEKEGIRSTVKALSRSSRDWLDLARQIRSADVVFVQKKLFTPWELFLLRRLARRLIYDFDDAVMTKDGPSTPVQNVRQLRRFKATVRRVDLVIAGNGYLREQALSINPRVLQLPTSIDADRYSGKKNDDKNKRDVVLGWIGSCGTLKYLREITPALEQLGRRFPQLRLKIVADDFFDLDDLPVIKKPWSAEEEIADLHSFDIGLMPLTDDLWTRGKCGFKLIQCMAVGMPVVCSPVGANTEIVTDEIEGFWASTQEEWFARLALLIEDRILRSEMGKKGREKVRKYYSLEANAPLLAKTLKQDIDPSE